MDSSYVIRRASVVSVHDEYEGMRIKVRLSASGDGTKSDEELDYCYPLLPKLLHVNPKPGETVLVLTEKLGASDSQRYFIGPLLSQPYNFYNENDSVSANSLLIDNNNNTRPQKAPSHDSKNTGTLPDRDDVAILGRRNSDIILKDEEVRIRCGMKQEPGVPPPNNLAFNKVDPAFIQLKYYETPRKTANNGEFNSVINVVADRINLISPRDGSPIFTGIPDPNDMVTDKVLFQDDDNCTILQNAHPLVYGDDLVSLLKQLIEVFRKHTHPYSMLPPRFNQNDTDILNTDLESMLSKTIRCN